MHYKVKSLMYLTCFLTSAIIYYNLSNQNKPVDKELITIKKSDTTTKEKTDSNSKELVEISELEF